VIGRRWGVSEAETTLAFGCDTEVADPVLELWRGVTVDAPAASLWPWVRMLTLAPYSYDLVDNLGRRSPRQLADLADPQPGDRAMRVARVVAAEPGRELTVQLGRSGGPVGRTVMSYQLVPAGLVTRLLLKVVVERGGPLTKLVTAGLPAGDLVMARKQLLTLKARCESHA
jgi:hypothetical protein